MADERFTNLSARLFQGYDPNTEFQEKGNLFSTVHFASATLKENGSLVEGLKSTVANVKNLFESIPSNTINENGVSSHNNFISTSSAAPFHSASENSFFSDNLSSISAGDSSSDSFYGLRTQGNEYDAAAPSNRSLAMVESIGNSNNNAAQNANVADTQPTVQTPVVTVQNSITLEGAPVNLQIGLTTDPNPDVMTSLILTGIPSDATLSAGIKNQDGTWTLTPDQLSGLILYPEAHTTGEITLSVTAVSRLGEAYAVDTETFKLTIDEPPPNGPVLETHNVSGLEDSAIALDISAQHDVNATLHVTITGVPANAILSAGTHNQDGSWTLTEQQLSNLTITPPQNFSGALDLTVAATSTENGVDSTTTSNLHVSVMGIADIPILMTASASGIENTNISLSISSALTDTDGSETLSITIYGVPTGASLSAGIDNGDGSWTLTPVQATNLSLIPPADFSGTFDLTVLAASHENTTNAYADATLTVTVLASAGAPTLTLSPASGNEDTPIALNIASAPADQNATLSLTVSGVPSGAILSAGTDNGNGTWTLTQAQLNNLTLTPPHNYSGDFNLTVTSTATENGTASTVSSPLSVHVDGVPDVPTLSVQTANGSENSPIALNIAAALTDTDGSETLAITVAGVPTGAHLSAGTDNGNGTWTLTSAQLTNLTITPPAFYSGNFNLSVTATSSESNQTASTTATSLSVHVAAVAETPTLAVTSSSGNEDSPIALHISAQSGDPSGHDALSFTVSGVPTGAILSAGTNNGNGSWTLTTAQLTNLTITPPHNYSGAFDLSVTVTETDGSSSVQASSPLHVTVAGVPDLPTLSVQASTGYENSPIALHINAALSDTDGSETLAVTVTGIPSGAHLSAGTDNGNGTWTLTSAQLTNLTITPPPFYSGNFNLGVVATSSENSQSISTGSSSLSVHVDPVASVPILSVTAVTGAEDSSIGLGINLQSPDILGHDILSVTVSGVPASATLSAGTDNGNGTWTLTAAQLTGLTINPPHNYSGAFDLTVTATATDGLSSVQASAPLHVIVTGVPDLPTLSVSAASGNQGSAIGLNITSALTDTDGSETLAVTVSGVPTGATLSAGTNNGNGTWTLTAAQLTNLTITPPSNYSGNFNLGVIATSSENNLSLSTSSTSMSVHVEPVAGAPVLNVSASSGNEDTVIALNIDAHKSDPLSADVITVTVAGVPTGATLSAGTNNGNGSWTLTEAQLTNLKITPPHNYSGAFDLNVTALATGGSTTAQTGGTLHVAVAGVPDLPTLNVQAATGNEGAPIALTINAALTDTDGSETLSVLVTGIPTSAHLSAGTDNGNGTWTLTSAQLTNLTITPPAFYNGNFNLGVVASSSENGQTASTGSTSLAVNVNPVASVPVLALTAAAGNEDTPIALNIGLSSPDSHDVLSATVSGVPSGAVLSAGTNNGNGTWTLTAAQLTNLTITPPHDYSGSFSLGVSATATDGSSTVQTNGTVSVTVAGVPDLPTLSVHAVSGNEGSPIALNITSALTDTDGSETLAVTVSGVPTGATLSAGTNNGNGTWTLTSAQLTNLTITPPAYYSGNFNLGVIATASENNLTASTSSSVLSVSVAGVATTPTLNVHAVTGNEDSAIPLGITSALVDNDGSETLALRISGVPTGATLSAGTNAGGGIWNLTPAQLTNLSLIPAANYSGSFNLSITATSTENGTTAPVTMSVPVTVHGVADVPTLSVQAGTGNEDTAIPLTITAGLTDTDGSESLSILVSGVPATAGLSAGFNNGNGTWTLTAAQLSGLTFTPPSNFGGTVALQVTAISTEHDGDKNSITVPTTITVTPVGDAPNLTIAAAIGKEDTAIPLVLSSALVDMDGSETLSVQISGVPTGATLSAGTNAGGGVWNLTPAQLTGLKITPPLNSDNDFILHVTATSTDSNGSHGQTSQDINVTVTGSADVPTVTATNTTGAINTAVAVNISGAVTDTDGSETLTYLVSGVPDGFSFNHGSNNGNNTWTLAPTDLTGLTLTSPYNYQGKVYMTAQSVSHDGDGDTNHSLGANFNVGIGNVSAGITLNLNANIGTSGIGVGTGLGVDVNLGGLLDPNGIVVHEDSVFPFVDAGLLLTLASGISYLNFTGLPVGASLSSGTDMGGGNWKIAPGGLAGLSLTLPPNSDQDFTLTITAKLAILTVTLATIPVHVLGVADIPTLSVANAIGNEDSSGIHISVTSALTDTDGSETLSFMIKDLPTGFTPTIGIHNGDGSWSLTAAQISSLSLKPPADFSGDATFTVVAVSTEREGDSTAVSAIGHIHVNPVADAPIITAVTSMGTEDSPVALNLGIALKDTDGSESISAVTISNVASGFSLTGATDNHDGTWSVDPAQLSNVKLVAPTHYSGDTTLTVTATSKESVNGVTASTTSTLNAHIEAVAQAPHATAHDVTGVNNHAITLDVGASLTDTDGSEHLSVVISNVPDHFIFSTGLNNGNGSWTFDESQLHNLTVTPNGATPGDVHMSLDAFAQDSNHTIATAHTDFTVHVTPDT